MIRVVHASPDAPAVDVYAEGVSSPLLEDVAYGETTSYLSVDPGTYNILYNTVVYVTGSTFLGVSVAAILAWASEARVAVIPFGGGTSVVGGVETDGEGYSGVVRRLICGVVLARSSPIDTGRTAWRARFRPTTWS